jgi:hypothetical protein
MKCIRAVFTAGAAIALAGAAFADERKDQVEAFMADYLRAWNAHDAATIVQRFYRLDGNHRWSTKEGLQAEFDRLKSQGYDRSEIQSITGCILGPDTAQAELRYIRLKTDGSFMPPKDRISVYQLRLFPDGWRATGFAALAPGAKMECPAT